MLYHHGRMSPCHSRVSLRSLLIQLEASCLGQAQPLLSTRQCGPSARPPGDVLRWTWLQGLLELTQAHTGLAEAVLQELGHLHVPDWEGTGIVVLRCLWNVPDGLC